MKLWRDVCTVLILLLPVMANAQMKPPTETRNAALRYWMAFAAIQDRASDKETQALLEKTAAGEAAWDEAKLGPILDANEEAISILQRATKLPDCDWGIEYSRGPRASIAFVPRARVLARLNTLAGMRAMAKGDTEAAVDIWLAGLRFSQDMARGGSLIYALVGKSAMTSTLNALSTAASNGKLNKTQKQRVSVAVSALPAYGFDWATAWSYESVGVEMLVREVGSDPNPKAAYEAMTGIPWATGFVRPTPEDVAKLDNYVSAVEDALKLEPDVAESGLAALQTELRTLNPAVQPLIPSAQKVNRERIELATVRRETLNAMSR